MQLSTILQDRVNQLPKCLKENVDVNNLCLILSTGYETLGDIGRAKLTLLILSVNQRANMLASLVSSIENQLRDYPSGLVEILVYIDNGEATTGFKRAVLSNMARSDYIAFIDDDDTLHPDYIGQLLQGTASGASVVTFKMNVEMQQNRRGVIRTTHEKWVLGIYPNNRPSGHMCVNHLCAWKTELALEIPWLLQLGYGDDQAWYQALASTGLIQTSWHINKCLYNYLYRESQTLQQGKAKREKSMVLINCVLENAKVVLDSLTGFYGIQTTKQRADGQFDYLNSRYETCEYRPELQNLSLVGSIRIH